MLVVNSVTDNSSYSSKSTTQGEESFQTWAKFSMQETFPKRAADSTVMWHQGLWHGRAG